MADACPACGLERSTAVPGLCGACDHATRVRAVELAAWLLSGEGGSGEVPGAGADDPDPLRWPAYGRLRAQARAATGSDESVLVRRGTLRGSGIEVVLIAFEFGFLAGSMGSQAGERIAAAYDHAREGRLPIVLLAATGGARVQEGMAALVQMAATAVAATAHARAGLLQVAVLSDPTTGGVFASHVNLADVLLAEPGGTIGFAGPRVAAALTDGPLPDGSHTAAGARAAGLVDAVVRRSDLPAALGALLAWPGNRDPVAVVEPAGSRLPAADPWTEVQRSRAGDRAGASEYLDALDVAFELHGDRAGSDDPTVRAVLAWLEGRPAVVVALDRTRNHGRVSPAGYRKAWRGLRLAGRLGVPVVTLIDTPGADPSASSEAGGIAHHIARTFAEVLDVRSPVVALVIGEGGSGGALALSVGDRLLIQEHATFSVIRPEGAAAILHRDATRAPEVAALLRPTAADLSRLGIADEVVPEPAGAEVRAALTAVARCLDELAERDPARLADARRARWRNAWRPGAGAAHAAPASAGEESP